MRKYVLTDFPLAPEDCAGVRLAPGDSVKVCAVPDVGFHGFTPLAASRYASLAGRVLRLAEFDEAGYAVIDMYYLSDSDLGGHCEEPEGCSSYHYYGFCFDPRDLQRA